MISLRHDELESLHFFDVLGLLSPSSPYGRERARQPFFFTPKQRHALEMEWQDIEKGVAALSNEAGAVEKLRHHFSQLRDIRATLARMKTETLDEVELFEVKRFLLQMAQIVPLYERTGAAFSSVALTEEPDALSVLDPDGMRLPAYSVHAGTSGPLYEARKQKALLEAKLRAEGNAAERRNLLEKRREWAAREEAEVLFERRRLTCALRPFADALLKNAEMIGRADFLLEKARLATSRGCTKPIIMEEGVRFLNMVNPKIDDILRDDGGFTPLCVHAPDGSTAITGANMGGKSVAIRTLALNVLLCHAGFFAFAERAELSLFDCAHILIADNANDTQGVSSFAAEVLKVQRLLSDIESGSRCFSIIDEPARGTNPEEGAALVKALMKKLSGRGAVCVVTTHFDGVASAATAHYRAAGLENLPDRMPEGAGVSWIARHMRYGLVRDDGKTPPPRSALVICRLLGLDREVLDAMEEALLQSGGGEGEGFLGGAAPRPPR